MELTEETGHIAYMALSSAINILLKQGGKRPISYCNNLSVTVDRLQAIRQNIFELAVQQRPKPFLIALTPEWRNNL
jgi:hypothetical protein